MTPKEKAKELVKKFSNYSEEVIYPKLSTLREFKHHPQIENAKECANACIEEITKEHCHNSEHKNPIEQDKWIQFWVDVKKEVELL